MRFSCKFNPSLSRELAPGDRRLWLLRSVALRIEQQANPLWRFEVFYRRLVIALAGLGLAGWLLASTALFLWLDRAPRNQVGWLDLAAPWRWPGIRAKRGDTTVLTALDELKAQDYPSAFYHLRVGLARSPGNVDGRLTLARLMAGYDPAHAVALLEEGLPFAGRDPRFLTGLFAFYGSLQIQAHALEVADRQLRDNAAGLPPGARFVLQRAKVILLLQLARYPEAEAALAGITPPSSPAERAGLDGLHLQVLLQAGRAAEARQFAATHPAAADDPARLRLDAEIALALGDADALQSALRHLKAGSPDAPGVYLFGFQAWHRMKRATFRDAAEREYLQLFGRNDGALQALAALAVNLDLPAVLADASRAAAANRLSQFAYRVHATELALRRGEIEPATRLLRDWENSVDTLKNTQRFYPEFIKRLTRAAFAGTPEQVNFLLAHLAAGRGQLLLPVYQFAATVLEKSGNLAGADRVLRAGLQLYSLSDPLLTAEQRVAAALLAAQQPARPGPAAAPAGPAFVLLPGGAAEARRQLDEVFDKDSLTAARDLLRAIRAQQPAWLPLMEAEVSVREVELAFLTLDQIASRAAARTYLDHYRNEEDQLRLVALASRLEARHRTSEARLLADEIVAAPITTVRVRQAVQELNLADDQAALVADQPAALGALDRWILAQEWVQAERLLKSLHDQPPAWFAPATAEVRLREVQVRLGLDQRPLALAALKELVIKGGAPRSLAFRLVRDLLARGERDQAGLLAREILKLLPDDPAAAKLAKEAEAPPPPD